MEIGQVTNASAPQPQPQAAAKSIATVAAKPTPAASEPAARSIGNTQLAQAVGQLNQSMRIHNVGLEFTIDEESHHTVVKVVDQQTKQLIRQIPSVEALEIAKMLDRMQGALIRQKA